MTEPSNTPRPPIPRDWLDYRPTSRVRRALRGKAGGYKMVEEGRP